MFISMIIIVILLILIIIYIESHKCGVCAIGGRDEVRTLGSWWGLDGDVQCVVADVVISTLGPTHI
jgi:hypothetical protein